MNNETMRICIDVVACQTRGSRHRGIGNYSAGLLNAIAKQLAPDDKTFLVGLQDQQSIREIETNVDGYIPKHRIKTVNLSGIMRFEDPAVSAVLHMQAATLARAYARTSPQVMHISSYFEYEPYIPSANLLPGLVKSVTLYDFIPYIFKEKYLSDPVMPGWYATRMSALRQCDLLFSISECTRQDAIRLLDIDPSKVVTIYGACGQQFTPAQVAEEDRQRLWAKYGITKPFVMYTGGIDWRKNIERTILAFSQLPPSTRAKHCLVIVCKVENATKEALLRLAKQAGLANDEVIMTGFVPDDDLLTFYRSCKAFIFPSIYEGMGLPILEAAACGAPVIAANNSSLPEMMPMRDALFEAQNTGEITAKMNQVLTDVNFRNSLKEFGIKHAATFTWEKSAQKVIESWRETLGKKLKPTKPTVPMRVPRPRLAYCSPLPPEQSGISYFSAQLVKYLSTYYEIELFTTAPQVDDPWLRANHLIHPLQALDVEAPRFDVIFYQFGNSSFHSQMIDLLKRWPGIVELHDFYMSGMLLHTDAELYRKELLYAHGARAFELGNNGADIWKTTWEFPTNKFIFENALGVIVHSKHAIELSGKFYPEGFSAPIALIPHHKIATIPECHEKRSEIRQSLQIKADEFVICTFGHVGDTKLPDVLIDAFIALLKEMPNAQLRLVFAGALNDNPFGKSISNKIAASDFRKNITITGFLSEKDYKDWIAACDIAVQLRKNSRGETSGALLDCLGVGKPVIINKHGSMTDYPDDIVLALNENVSTESLAKALKSLHADADLRAELGKKARQFVIENNDPNRLALMYFETMQAMMSESTTRDPRRLIEYATSRKADKECISTWLSKMAETDVVLRPPRVFTLAQNVSRESWKKRVVKISDPSLTKDIWPVVFVPGHNTLKMGRIATNGSITETDLSVGIQNGDILLIAEEEKASYADFLTALSHKGVTIKQLASDGSLANL